MNAIRSMVRKQGREWQSYASSRQQNGFKPKTECEIIEHTKNGFER